MNCFVQLLAKEEILEQEKLWVGYVFGSVEYCLPGLSRCLSRWSSSSLHEVGDDE